MLASLCRSPYRPLRRTWPTRLMTTLLRLIAFLTTASSRISKLGTKTICHMGKHGALTDDMVAAWPTALSRGGHACIRASCVNPHLAQVAHLPDVLDPVLGRTCRNHHLRAPLGQIRDDVGADEAVSSKHRRREPARLRDENSSALMPCGAEREQHTDERPPGPCTLPVFDRAKLAYCRRSEDDARAARA